MALRLRNEQEWTEYLKTTVGLGEDKSTQYAKLFTDNQFTEEILSELSREILRELGITVLGDVLTILKKCKLAASTTSSTSESHPIVKPPPPKLPTLTMETTMPQWRKFQFDWKSFKNITQLPDSQVASQLYTACDETVQMSLIITVPNVFELSEDDLLKEIENIVFEWHSVNFCKDHRNQFRTMLCD